MHCLFGYGSLISADSRARTGVGGAALAVELSGIARRWSVPVPDYRATAVGAHAESTARCNGVVFGVDDANLARFDERERGYERVRIDWSDVSPLNSGELPTDQPLWAYVGHSSEAPLAERPIMQTYLDVILAGCLEWSEAFARRFLQTTGPWRHLADDRQAPHYPRALTDRRIQPQVDALLAQELPQLLDRRLPVKA